MIKFNTLYKILQRKCYDILSLQYAFLLIIVSCFLFIMSLVHFGEVCICVVVKFFLVFSLHAYIT